MTPHLLTFLYVPPVLAVMTGTIYHQSCSNTPPFRPEVDATRLVHRHLRLIGLTGGLLAHIRRPLAGAISVIAAALLAHFGARWAYGLNPPSPNFLEPFTLLQAVVGPRCWPVLALLVVFSRATFA